MNAIATTVQAGGRRPYIVGIGGTVKPGSSTEQALQIALRAASDQGAEFELFGGALLAQLPHYGLPEGQTSETAARLVAALRKADGVIIASPGYHGSVSGLVKNAIDYTEDMVNDPRVYFEGLPVGLIATAYGWQATGSTLAALRSIVHALRGWPTPLGAGINCAGGIFKDGVCTQDSFTRQLRAVGQQVAEAVIRNSAFRATG
jgi:FMN reductase